MMYVPLRVYSVFSQGKGAVGAAALAQFLEKKKIPSLAIADPFSLIGWEYFYGEAERRGLKPLLGMEARLQNAGSLVLFPTSIRGYLSLVSSLNRKNFAGIGDMAAIFIPGGGLPVNQERTLQLIRDRVGAEHFYLGLEWHSKRWLVEMAQKYSVPLVWAQPLKWTERPDPYAAAAAVFHHRPIAEILNEVGSGRDPSLYGVLNGRAIVRRWGDIGRAAMRNTFAVADSIGFTFHRMFKTEDGQFDVLEEIVNGKMRNRLLTMAEQERAYRELKIIKDMGFSPYFLIGAEIGSYCRKNRIYFNLRGSGVSSFILYLLGISRINPLRHNLLFERFVNSLREDLPDIDIDIESSRRSQVLSWVFEHYGGRVAFVSTHKFFGARSALYEVARTYGMPPEEAHGLSKELPMFASPAELKGRGSGQLAEIYNWASLLEGVYKELSLHVGGVVFANGAVSETFPLEESPQGFGQTIWDKNTIERLNIFKLDLLGVRGFDVISPVALGGAGEIDFRDPEVWENIRKAGTVGCFQLESPLARKNLIQTLPRNMDELGISIAIIRPGPAKSGMKAAYIEKKSAFHPLLQKIFPHTRGTVIFEEQISLLLYHLTGWSLEFCEKVRRALKKKSDLHKDEFFRRGQKNGWSRRDLQAFWKLAGDFSLYAFNQAHSIAYAYSAYLSAWLKVRQPVTFFCRLLNSGGGYYPLPFYIEEVQKWGVRLLPPDVNSSMMGFSEERGQRRAIRTGLVFVKGVGQKLAAGILAKRGPGFTGIEDFIARTGIGDRELSVLMAVCAFRSLKQDRFSPAERGENWRRYLGFVPDLDLDGEREARQEQLVLAGGTAVMTGEDAKRI
jgi:DNA polymerase III alpha subunit